MKHVWARYSVFLSSFSLPFLSSPLFHLYFLFSLFSLIFPSILSSLLSSSFLSLSLPLSFCPFGIGCRVTQAVLKFCVYLRIALNSWSSCLSGQTLESQPCIPTCSLPRAFFRTKVCPPKERTLPEFYSNQGMESSSNLLRV